MLSTTQPRSASASRTTERQANALIDNGRVALVEDAVVYRIQGRTGVYTVTLTDTEQTCNCEWTRRRTRPTDDASTEQVLCSHIVAAQALSA